MDMDDLANKLSAFSPKGMRFGIAKKEQLEVHWREEEVKFISRAEGFTLLKLFLQGHRDSLVQRVQDFETRARVTREDVDRVDFQLKQLEHKSISDAYTLLASITSESEEESK